MNHIPVEPLNVPIKSLNVWNGEIFHEVKVLGEYTTTAVIWKKTLQRDIDHLCTDEDILQQIRKNIRAVLNLVEVNNRNII